MELFALKARIFTLEMLLIPFAVFEGGKVVAYEDLPIVDRMVEEWTAIKDQLEALEAA